MNELVLHLEQCLLGCNEHPNRKQIFKKLHLAYDLTDIDISNDDFPTSKISERLRQRRHEAVQKKLDTTAFTNKMKKSKVVYKSLLVNQIINQLETITKCLSSN